MLLCGDSKNNAKQNAQDQKVSTPAPIITIAPTPTSVITPTTPPATVPATVLPPSPAPAPLPTLAPDFVPGTKSEISLLKNTVKAGWGIMRLVYLAHLCLHVKNWIQSWGAAETEQEGFVDLAQDKAFSHPILHLLTLGGVVTSSLYNDYVDTPPRYRRSIVINHANQKNHQNIPTATRSGTANNATMPTADLKPTLAQK